MLVRIIDSEKKSLSFRTIDSEQLQNSDWYTTNINLYCTRTRSCILSGQRSMRKESSAKQFPTFKDFSNSRSPNFDWKLSNFSNFFNPLPRLWAFQTLFSFLTTVQFINSADEKSSLLEKNSDYCKCCNRKSHFSQGFTRQWLTTNTWQNWHACPKPILL